MPHTLSLQVTLWHIVKNISYQHKPMYFHLVTTSHQMPMKMTDQAEQFAVPIVSAKKKKKVSSSLHCQRVNASAEPSFQLNIWWRHKNLSKSYHSKIKHVINGNIHGSIWDKNNFGN